jgi:hypothetical protein
MRHTFLIRILLLVSLLLCTYLAVRRGVGAWYFRKGTPEAIQTAMKWDPANPEYYDALGTMMHLYGDGRNSTEIVQFYESATRLGPHAAQFWADLGAGYDWAGRSSDALQAFQRAQQLFPNSPEINWKLANFLVRAGKTSEALHTLRMVLLEDATSGRKVFILATNATRDKEAILQMLPLQAPIFFDYLNFRIERGDIVGAKEVWGRILQMNLPFDLHAAFPYLDALIQHKEIGQLAEAWSALAGRFPEQIRSPVPGSNLVTNGSFELETLNGGLDWRIIPVEGTLVSLDSAGGFEGARALQIKFSGSRNLDYGHVFQYVPVRPNTRYRFSGYMRVQGITTDCGPRFQVFDAANMADLLVSTENLIGTSGWSKQNAQFTTKADTHLLLIRVARPLSSRFDNQIAGVVWLTGVSLNPE